MDTEPQAHRVKSTVRLNVLADGRSPTGRSFMARPVRAHGSPEDLAEERQRYTPARRKETEARPAECNLITNAGGAYGDPP